jgi:protein TilB
LNRYVRIVAKGKLFQVALPEEVCPDRGDAKRSLITGHLLLTLPKLNPRRKASCSENETSQNKLNRNQQENEKENESVEKASTKELMNLIPSREKEKEMQKEQRERLLKQMVDGGTNEDEDIPPLE